MLKIIVKFEDNNKKTKIEFTSFNKLSKWILAKQKNIKIKEVKTIEK